MDFFEHQERARRKTGWLVLLYVLAVTLIMLSVYFAFAITLGIAQSTATANAAAAPLRWWVPELFMLVMVGTLVVVLGGTTYKVLSLARGGVAVASLLGGRQINRNTSDPDERKMLNVVEEMSIAAGIPVPPVFLLDQEDSINAFAAGGAPTDAVIGITRGAIRQLSRDELQGVIAHEFSHIFNGDMRLNIRLMGVLHGILLIGLIGYWLMRSSMYAGRSRSSGKGKGDSRAQIVILGLALTVIGFVGVFFAKLIKSAVSRQREFLADAAAVQFTRNPAGIASALKKIGGYDTGSKIANRHAEEASHFFFANGLSAAWFSLMATHPPLDERIRRLDAAWDQAQPSAAAAQPAQNQTAAAMGFAGAGRTVQAQPKNIMASVGAPQHAHLDYATGMLAAIPPALHNAARAPLSACAVIYNLLLSGTDATRAKQLHMLEQTTAPEIHRQTVNLSAPIKSLSIELRLPLADITIATLKELAPDQYAAFRDATAQLIIADDNVDLFEYTLHRMILRHLAPFFEKLPPVGIRYHSLRALRAQCVDLLSCLAHWGDEHETAAHEYFTSGLARLADAGGAGWVRDVAIRERQACGVQMLDAALQELAQAEPALKRNIMDACVACVMANDIVNVQEAQVLRAIGDYLGCPIPPVMAGAA